jgi:lysophospholipase L1-like esterase
MINYKTFFFFLLVLLLQNSNVLAQDAPFKQDIEAFKKQDSISFPPKNAILFVGSSSFRLWTSLTSAFPDKKIINRGFGGSKIPEVEFYAEDIIFPYRPKQIVIYCGENDLAEQGINADSVLMRFKNLFQTIRNENRNIKITYVSIKPSPSRQHLMTEMVRANTMINGFVKQQKKTSFVDVFSLMLDENGRARSDIFVDDMLHLNEKGYAIWAEAIAPYLIK